jgi:pimeloyl-ACP methyl ester carboxylesterase
MSESADFLESPSGARVAYVHAGGASPGLFWLSGFNSDMTAGKPAHLAAFARARGQAFTALDYSGRGRSSGDPAAVIIGAWRADVLAVFDAVAEGPQVLVASSTGAWIALHTALARPGRVTGLVLLAPATDFTEDVLWAMPELRRVFETQGAIARPAPPGQAPHPFTLTLIEEARAHLLLRAPISVAAPVHILHGRADNQIPWPRALLHAEKLAGDVTVEIVADADHNHARPADLARMIRAVERLLQKTP